MSSRRQKKKASPLAKRVVAHKHNGRITGFKLAERNGSSSEDDPFARWIRTQSSAQAAIDFVVDSGMVDNLARKAAAVAAVVVPAEEEDDDDDDELALSIESEVDSVQLERIDDDEEMPAPPIPINLSAQPAVAAQKPQQKPLAVSQPQSLDMSGNDDKPKKKKRAMGRRSIVPTLAQSDPIRAKIYSAGMGTVNAKLSETCIRSGSHALSVSVRDGRTILYTTPAASARLSNNPRLLAQIVNLLSECENSASNDQPAAVANDVSRYGALATSQNARALNIRGNCLGADQKSIVKTSTADVALSLPISSLNRVSSFAASEQQQPSRKRRVDSEGFVVPLPKHASNSESDDDDDDDDGGSDESSFNCIKANFEAAANDVDEEESEGFDEPAPLR